MTDDKTRIVRRGPSADKTPPSPSAEPAAEATEFIRPQRAETTPSTQKINVETTRKVDTPEQPVSHDADDVTRVFRPNRKKATAPTADITRPVIPPVEKASEEEASDPVVGWLVVTKGPGKGSAVELGYGMNSIGRSTDERVCLNFGDSEISRKGHAMLTYDPRGRKFFVQHGGGSNLTYVGDIPLLQPTELTGGEIIGIGQSELRFVPFCGADFDWQDQ